MFKKEADAKMLPAILKKALLMVPTLQYFAKWGPNPRHIARGAGMNEVVMLRGTEPRRILQTVIEKQVPAIMSYLSGRKWYVAKVVLTGLGANRLNTRISPRKKPHPINIRVNQPVGISLKYEYGKFIFETKVIDLEPSPDGTSGGAMVLAVPDRIEIIQRRSYFRVAVPGSLKVNVLLWHRARNRTPYPVPRDPGPRATNERPATSNEQRDYWQGRFIDISAGGAQVAVDIDQGPDFKEGQFIGLRFTPLPYETPLMLNAQVRNILPTVNGKSICLGLQIVGLEASAEGRQVLARLVGVVERYYQINQSGAKQHDMLGSDFAENRRIGARPTDPH